MCFIQHSNQIKRQESCPALKQLCYRFITAPSALWEIKKKRQKSVCGGELSLVWLVTGLSLEANEAAKQQPCRLIRFGKQHYKTRNSQQ